MFSRPAVVGLLYAFFFETILSELPVPGTVKRLSINYYTRCLMYSAAGEKDVDAVIRAVADLGFPSNLNPIRGHSIGCTGDPQCNFAVGPTKPKLVDTAVLTGCSRAVRGT